MIGVSILRQGVTLTMLLTPLLAGCYRYVPVNADALAAGSRVRLAVTAEGAERIGGLHRDERIEGRVVDVPANGSIMLEVPQPSGDAPVGITSRPLFSRVELRPRDLTGIELKSLDRTRTILLVAGSAAVAAVLVDLAFEARGGGGEGNGGGVNEVVVPWFSVRW